MHEFAGSFIIGCVMSNCAYRINKRSKMINSADVAEFFVGVLECAHLVEWEEAEDYWTNDTAVGNST